MVSFVGKIYAVLIHIVHRNSSHWILKLASEIQAAVEEVTHTVSYQDRCRSCP